MRSFKKNTDFQINYQRLAVAAFSVLLIVLHFVRIFDNNFWGDEAYTIRLSQMNFTEMLMETAADVHPPLYYFIVQLFCKLFGYSGAVYHLASLVPYVIGVVVALTVIWKWFGMEASILFILLSSLLETAVTYNVEVRMYSWGALFLLLSFLALYRIFTRNQTKDYVCFVLFSLGTAYTHYYCLISVAFFYIVLIGLALVKRKEYFKRTLIACLVTVAAYLPWLIALIQTLRRTMGDFWMLYIPYLKDCFGYMFSGSLQYVLFAVMLLAVAFSAWYQRKDCGKVLWLAAGLCSIFGTIMVGNVVSRLFRPVMIVRYLYPVSIIAWVLLAVGISGCRRKRLYTGLLAAALLITSGPQFIRTVQAEKTQNVLLQETLEATSRIAGAGNVIVTDLEYIDWTVGDYYYPGSEQIYMGDGVLPALTEGKDYWLMLSGKLSEEMTAELQIQGYVSEILVEQGVIGTNPVVVYELQESK